MSDNAYGVVVTQYKTQLGVWQLFSRTESHLTALDPRACGDALCIGDIVQARSDENETQISRRAPFVDAIWSDGRRVVIRTIVSRNNDEDTVTQGRWKDEDTGHSVVLLISRDIGIVFAPVQWYLREFSEAHANHLYAFVEFLPRSLTCQMSDEIIDCHWTIVDNRISLPALPASHENTEQFLEPEQILQVPALTLRREGRSMLMWSYTLGTRLAILEPSEMIEDVTAIGQWLMVAALRSSARDLATHGCSYQVKRHHNEVEPYSQPEVTVVNEKIRMTLPLNRSEPDPEDPDAPVKVWHDFWGLPVDYCGNCVAWIRGETSQFRAVVEISVSQEEEAEGGRRVAVKAVAPVAMPRHFIKPAPPAHSDIEEEEFVPYEDLNDEEKAVRDAEWACNCDKDDDPWLTATADDTMSSGQWSDAPQSPIETKEFSSWSDTPQKEEREKSASTTPQQKTPILSDNEKEEMEKSESTTPQQTTPNWSDNEKNEKSESTTPQQMTPNWSETEKKEEMEKSESSDNHNNNGDDPWPKQSADQTTITGQSSDGNQTVQNLIKVFSTPAAPSCQDIQKDEMKTSESSTRQLTIPGWDDSEEEEDRKSESTTPQQTTPNWSETEKKKMEKSESATPQRTIPRWADAANYETSKSASTTTQQTTPNWSETEKKEMEKSESTTPQRTIPRWAHAANYEMRKSESTTQQTTPNWSETEKKEKEKSESTTPQRTIPRWAHAANYETMKNESTTPQTTPNWTNAPKEEMGKSASTTPQRTLPRWAHAVNYEMRKNESATPQPTTPIWGNAPKEETGKSESTTPQRTLPRWAHAVNYEMRKNESTTPQQTNGETAWKEREKENENESSGKTWTERSGKGSTFSRPQWSSGFGGGGLKGGGAWQGGVSRGGYQSATGISAGGWVNSQQQQQKPQTAERKCSDGEKGFVPILQPKAPSGKSPANGGFENEEIVAVPIRAYRDRQTEREWRVEMEGRGWQWPEERREIESTFGQKQPTTYKSPMPIEQLLKNPYLLSDVMKLKRRQCLITKVRFAANGMDADMIQLYVLNGDPAFIVHKMGNNSYLKDRPEFTTVGNIVELHIGRRSEGWYVHDEMWRLVRRVKLPMREAVNEKTRVKSLELIVNAQCLSPQAGQNMRHRQDKNGFILLNDETVHNICYYGKSIDPREHETYTFQVVVVPVECPEAHTFWKATEVMWRVPKDSTLDPFFKAIPEAPSMQDRDGWPSLGISNAPVGPGNSWSVDDRSDWPSLGATKPAAKSGNGW